MGQLLISLVRTEHKKAIVYHDYIELVALQLISGYEIVEK
jgi:hypothetical protein